MMTKNSILDALRSPDITRRLQVIAELPGSAIDHDVLQLLIKTSSKDKDEGVRLQALHRLEQIWPDTTIRRQFLETLTSGDLETAGPVATSLGRLGDGHARSILLEAYTGSKSFAIKWLCFDTLLSSWEYDAIQDLVTGYFLNDNEEVIRASAASYVGRHQDPSMVPELMALLEDPAPRVRSNALEALTPLARVVGAEVFEKMTRDPDHRVRACAAVALVNHQDSFSMEGWLETVVQSSFDLSRASAAWVLRKVPGVTNRSRFLETLLSDPSQAVQRQAILAQKALN